MEIKKTAIAGSLESSDIMITINPGSNQNISINLDSTVEKQFGRRIREVIEKTLHNLGVTSAEVEAVDKGALDCTIQARTIVAVHRAAEEASYNWKEIDLWNV